MGRFLEVALEILFIYFLYRLVFDFIIPIYRSSKKVREHMQEMQNRMQDNLRQEQQRQNATPPPPPPPQQNKVREGEYIDYEEVKENP
ncbi:MAG TPA: hypothetical protein VFX43_05245 [Chitinophagaceae bacterium]|jgi:hypothetical protein|nr:hypothetical protein [Chitinophagaceae bacterium]